MVPVILYPLAKRFTYWPQAVLGRKVDFEEVLLTNNRFCRI